MSNSEVIMPRVEVVPAVETNVEDVQLSKPSEINAGNPSAFPLQADVFKGLNYQSASNSQLNKELSQYYTVMSKVMAGTATDTDLANLIVLTEKIREFVLTDDDYNLVIGALQKMQTYILKFMYVDIRNKAAAMDAQLNVVIGDLNRFMTDLEVVYSKSPSDYPIPDGSVLKPKLEAAVQSSLTYVDRTQGVIMSSTQPARPSNRDVIWFNVGTPVL